MLSEVQVILISSVGLILLYWDHRLRLQYHLNGPVNVDLENEFEDL